MLEILKKRNLPACMPREKMLSVLAEEEYGILPPAPEAIRFEESKNLVQNFCAGKANYYKVTAICTVDGKEFSFPFYAVIPTKKGKYPFFVHINFRPDVPDRYMPTEELVDNGFAVLSFCYNDVTLDQNEFESGLGGVLYAGGARPQNGAGKLAMWAWAAHRVMDYAETKAEVLDLSNACVCGHSRLGKTALLAAATDERFRFAHSNDSGCGGAAISRGKGGETIERITNVFPMWFCENFKRFVGKENEMPFDQHYLIAAIAPRYVSVASAEEDLWADPESEQLACLAASAAFEENGAKGLVCPDRFAEVGETFFDGHIGYQKRAGAHYFSREDWLKLMVFVKKHLA